VASNFTAHNIRLDDGSLTKPEQPWQMEDLVLLKFIKRFLRILFPEGVSGKRLVDLGCLEGGYTVELARAGFDALGIEVRQSNFENCQRVKAETNLPNLTFACDDVLNLAKYGVFDVVFCCGLLYHLDEPRKFLNLMAQVCQRVIISDTHVADEQLNGEFELSKITENEGWAGRWFSELHEGSARRWLSRFTNENPRHEYQWSAWNNRKSFWPMKRDLMQGLFQAGFTTVLESPTFEPYLELTHRVTIVGVKD